MIRCSEATERIRMALTIRSDIRRRRCKPGHGGSTIRERRRAYAMAHVLDGLTRAEAGQLVGMEWTAGCLRIVNWMPRSG